MAQGDVLTAQSTGEHRFVAPPVDQAAATGSLRTLGKNATQAAPGDIVGAWRQVFMSAGRINAGAVAATGGFDMDANWRASAVTSAANLPVFPLLASDHAVSGLTTKYKIKMVLGTNGTAPTINFTAGLSNVTAYSGGANAIATTFAAQAGNTVTRSAPAINSVFTNETAEGNLPADGVYLPTVLTSANMPATNPSVAITLSIWVRNV